MKVRIIGFVAVLVVLVTLFVLTSGNTDTNQSEPLQIQPQSKFNF